MQEKAYTNPEKSTFQKKYQNIMYSEGIGEENVENEKESVTNPYELLYRTTKFANYFVTHLPSDWVKDKIM